MMRRTSYAIIVSLFSLVAVIIGQVSLACQVERRDQQPKELGDVQWSRDLDAARAVSGESGKPIFLLFQEIPGCETCQSFGDQPLSHPQMVEAIEDLFVPVVVYNNRKGRDAALLREFNEPSWNNPVVRFLNAKKQDLIPRKDRVWDTVSLAGRMIETLEKAKQPVPKFLSQLAKTGSLETATFAMHCYWEGEAKLGSIDGVRDTRSGWKDKLEVVQVKFDPSIVNYEQLLDAAQEFECATKVFAHNANQLKTARAKVGNRAVRAKATIRDAKLSDQVYYVRQSKWRHLPLTEWQAMKINGVLHQRLAASQSQERIVSLLSPRQVKMLDALNRVLQATPTAMASFRWPDDDSKLATYQARFEKAIMADRNSK